MTGAHRGTRRGAAASRAALLALAALLVLLAAPASLGATSASFTATTRNEGDHWAADTVAPPTALSANQSCTAPAVITFRGSAVGSGASAATATVPVGTVAGDVLFAQVVHSNTAAVVSSPGWTSVRRDAFDGVMVSALFVRTFVSGYASATFSVPAGTSAQVNVALAAYGGVDASAPVDASAVAMGTGSTAVFPAVTTTKPDTVLLRMVTNAYERYPAPAGTTPRWAFGTSGGLTGSDEPFAGPGTAPVRYASSPSGTSAQGIGQTVALRHTPGTPSVVLTWTASPSSWATGYLAELYVSGVLRGSRTVTPISATSTTGGPLTNGTTYTAELTAYRGSWTSAPVSATLTPSCP
jgi:hypothetical protein